MPKIRVNQYSLYLRPHATPQKTKNVPATAAFLPPAAAVVKLPHPRLYVEKLQCAAYRLTAAGL